MDDGLDRLHGALKRFLGELSQRAMNEEETCAACPWILVTAVNLEHAGDIMDKGLLSLAAKRIRRRLRLTSGRSARPIAMHEHLLAQLRLAVAVFMGEDLGRPSAWSRRRSAFASWSAARLKPSSPNCRRTRGAATGGLLLDIVRDLKRVEAHLAAIAHPLLERSNLLRPTRLISRC